VNIRTLLNIVGQVEVGIVELIITGLRARRRNAHEVTSRRLAQQQQPVRAWQEKPSHIYTLVNSFAFRSPGHALVEVVFRRRNGSIILARRIGGRSWTRTRRTRFRLGVPAHALEERVKEGEQYCSGRPPTPVIPSRRPA